MLSPLWMGFQLPLPNGRLILVSEADHPGGSIGPSPFSASGLSCWSDLEGFGKVRVSSSFWRIRYGLTRRFDCLKLPAQQYFPANDLASAGSQAGPKQTGQPTCSGEPQIQAAQP